MTMATEASERVARSLALEKAYVHQVYQQISDATDALPDKGRAWPKVKQFLSDLEPGSLVCDVGCGNGKYLDANPSVFEVGVDRCKRLTEVAREKDHEVLMCDNLALPFRDESFDAVLSIAVVHHFATTDRRVQALRELARVLKIGGKLIISVWAMEQRHRKFESQDVLVPWHKPQQLSTPSLEFTSTTTTTTTTTTSEDDGPHPYHAYTQTSDSESTRSHRGNNGVRKRGRNWHKGRSIDPSRPISSSQSSSSLSSPNETCYSFVRRALQKLAGGKRGSSGRHRPWFIDTWTACTKEPPPRRYDPDGCEDIDAEDIQDLPIELRRLEEDSDLPQRRQTYACSQTLSSSIEISLGYKSKSLSDILTINQKCMVRSRSSASNLDSASVAVTAASAAAFTGLGTTTFSGIATTTTTATTAAAAVEATTTETSTSATTNVLAVRVITSQPKPKLVKQKQSLCEEEMEEEGGDLPTDIKDLVKRLPEFKVSTAGESRKQGNVFKQSSMNEELMSTERLREKEIVRQNIQKQASLNDEFLFRRQTTFDSIRDTFFSTSTARRFQLLKDGLTNKIKSSTTGIEKVAGSSFKNGFVRILQGWKNETSGFTGKSAPATPPCDMRRTYNFEEKTANANGGHFATTGGERRHSKEDGSDSSKDSSLQSDTSVDSEDSFASVIFIPKPDAASETSPPTNTSPPSVALTSPTFHSLPQSPQPTSPKLKGSLPPSPKFKYQSPTSPIIKQPSLPCKYQSPTSPNLKTQLPTSPVGLTKQHSLPTSPKFKYSLPPLSPSLNKNNDTQLSFQQKLKILSSQQVSPGCVASSRQSSLEMESMNVDQPKSVTPVADVTGVQMTAASAAKQCGNPLPALLKAEQDQENGEEKVRGNDESMLVIGVTSEKVETLVQAAETGRSKTTVHQKQQCFPIVRRSFITTGSVSKQENLAKPLPKLLSLELFNPETDDVDSDSSGVSSPDSVSSVISVLTEELSAESHDAQQAKRSPSDGQSNSNSANDSDINSSDQSLSSLPNSKSPEFLCSKSPENTTKSSERTKNSDASGNSRTSEVKNTNALKDSSKPLKSPETLSSSSDSLSKSTEFQKDVEARSKEMTKLDQSPEVEEIHCTREEQCLSERRSSSKSPELMCVKLAAPKHEKEDNYREKLARKRDEKFVAPALEMKEERPSPTRRNFLSRSSSPANSLIEAAVDVVTSLEGAVEAVIQSSPRARRRQLELVEPGNSAWVVEDYSPAPSRHSLKQNSPESDDTLSRIFKKCVMKQSLKLRHEVSRKKSPECGSSHDEPYPDFKFCKMKCHDDKSRRLSVEKYRTNRSVSIENMPLLTSNETGSGHYLAPCDNDEFSSWRSEVSQTSRETGHRDMDSILGAPWSMETGSSWSLGRSERFYHSLREAENEEKRKNSSTWSLNRYKLGWHGKDDTIRNSLRGNNPDWKGGGSYGKSEPKPTVRILQAEATRRETSRNVRSLGLKSSGQIRNIEDRLAESWGEEYRMNLANFADRLSEKLAEEIDQYREESNSKHFYSSLPSRLEHMDDPYLTRLSSQLLDLNRLSAELKETNNYVDCISDEDVNRELSKSRSETNPFMGCSGDASSGSESNPFQALSNPFPTDDSESEPSKSDDSDLGNNRNELLFTDSFVPFEIDSPPKKGRQLACGEEEDEEDEEDEEEDEDEDEEEEEDDKRLVEGIEERASDFESFSAEVTDKRSPKSSGSWKSSKDKKKNIFFVKSASLDDSYKFLGRRPVAEKPKKAKDEVAEVRIKKDNANSRNELAVRKATSRNVRSPSATRSAESTDLEPVSGSRKNARIPSWESMETDSGTATDIPRELSKMTIASSLGYSMESSDPEVSGGTGSGSDCSRRDASRVTVSTASLGHSIESSDPGDVSERTGSGSDFSRKETSSADTGRTADSTASLEPESGSDCSKDTGYADRRAFRCDGRSSSEETPRRMQLVRQKSITHEPLETLAKTESFGTSLNGSTSQESLPSDGGGGAITFHRYYHVFREGELDQLIEKYVDNLHIISSYYDHANWCVIAEKVQVWTI